MQAQEGQEPMLTLDYQLDGSPAQYGAMDAGIRVVQFIRNKCLRAVRRVNGDLDFGQKTEEVENTTFRTDALSEGETRRGVEHGVKAGKLEDV